MLPDLVVIDGGKGQLSAAKEVLDELGYGDLAVVGLAKERFVQLTQSGQLESHPHDIELARSAPNYP